MPSEPHTNTLSSECKLEEYRIEKVLGVGSFGVTYKALDTRLGEPVAIKEYFPAEWSYRDADTTTVHPSTRGKEHRVGDRSVYEWGLDRFLTEARMLAKIKHPSVVRVRRYLPAWNTAYIVMDYEEGQPLSKLLDPDKTLPEEGIRRLLDDVLSALENVHQHNFLHRDIKPSNLYVRAVDQRVILIDFGAARIMWDDNAKGMTSMFTSGYSPLEQYGQGDDCGAGTDIYALGAVLYRCITGQTPMPAPDRGSREMKPAIQAGEKCYSANLLSVIDKALAREIKQRFRDVAEMRAALAGERHTVIMPPVLNKPKGDIQAKMPPKSATVHHHSTDNMQADKRPKQQRSFVVPLRVIIALVALVVILWLWLSGSQKVILPVEKPVSQEVPAAAKNGDDKPKEVTPEPPNRNIEDELKRLNPQ